MIAIVWFIVYWLFAFALWQSGMTFASGFVCGAGWLFWVRIFARAVYYFKQLKERKDGT